MPTIVGFYGLSNSGKTTLITKLIQYYSNKKILVGTIKCSSHSFTIDSKNTDSWKHRQAGASSVLFSGPNETVIQWNQAIDEKQAVEILQKIAKLDMIFIEGSKHPDILKIRLGNISLRENTIETINAGEVTKAVEIINTIHHNIHH